MDRKLIICNSISRPIGGVVFYMKNNNEFNSTKKYNCWMLSIKIKRKTNIYNITATRDNMYLQIVM